MQDEPYKHTLSDQASRLRQMKLPGVARKSNLDFFVPSPKLGGPRFTLLSEAPGSCHARKLACLMAMRLAEKNCRSLIVDLTPSASTLPGLVLSELGYKTARPQPLWSESVSGRGLARWALANDSLVDLVAQPVTEFPTAEQLSRIYEQMIRRFEAAGSTSEAAWQRVFLISDLAGLPLDRVCWNAADDIVVLARPAAPSDVSLAALTTARLSSQPNGQRRLLVWKQPWKLGRLRWGLRRASHDNSLGTPLNSLEQFNAYGMNSDAKLPKMAPRSHAWLRRSVAHQLLNELETQSERLGFRQAS